MRILRPDADLTGIPFPLSQELANCLARWAESGVPYGPDDDLIVLVEVDDTVDAIAQYLGLLVDVREDDFAPPAEWTSDRGCAYELYICLNDDGAGCSIFVPKADGIDTLLLELCEAYVTQQPPLT